MKLRVLCSKAYTRINCDELDEVVKQQFIFCVQNNIIRKQLIIERPTQLKDKIEYVRV